MARELVLCFFPDGVAVLEEKDEGIWFSDDDDDFREHHEDEVLDLDDAETVLEFLHDEGIITEEELSEVEIETDDGADDEEEDDERDESTEEENAQG